MVGGAGSTAAPGRREQLVEAAFAQVARVGFEGLRLRQVAGSVGIDHSTLHHHMATKQDLVRAVAEFATGQFRSTMPVDDDPVAQLRGHLALLEALIRSRPDLLAVTAELDLRAQRDPAVAELVRRVEQGWRAGLAEVLGRGAATGAWPDADVPATVELVIAVVKGCRLSPDLAGPVLRRLGQLLGLGR